MRSTKKYKKRKSKKYLETILSVFILLSMLIGGLTGYYGSKVMSFLDNISTDDNTEENFDSIEMTKQIENKEPFAALILGTDIEDAGVSRTDSIIVATVNPKKQSVKLISIPRDTLIELPNGTSEKINAAYTVGGTKLTMDTVSELLNIPIEFYTIMDFNGLVELVDAVGGITVDSKLSFTQHNIVNPKKVIEITEGLQTLDGEETLGYARMRKKDPRGDFGRQDRQKDVIEGVLNKLISFKTVTNFTNILDSIQPYLKTNASSNQMLGIASSYQKVLNNVEQLSLNGEAGEEYFPHYGLTVYVWKPYEESLEKVSTELREHLELGDPLMDDNIQNPEETVAPPREPLKSY